MGKYTPIIKKPTTTTLLIQLQPGLPNPATGKGTRIPTKPATMENTTQMKTQTGHNNTDRRSNESKKPEH